MVVRVCCVWVWCSKVVLISVVVIRVIRLCVVMLVGRFVLIVWFISFIVLSRVIVIVSSYGNGCSVCVLVLVSLGRC